MFAQPATSNYILPYNTQTRILRIQNLYQGLPTDSIIVVTGANRWLGRIALSDYAGFDSRYKGIGYIPTWNEITGKPDMSETDPTISAYVKGINAGYFANGNTAFSWGNHTGLYRPITYVPVWSEITSKPTTFTPAAHTHSVSQVTGLGSRLDSISTSLAGKQSTGNYLTGITSTQVNTALGFTPISKASTDLLYKPIGYVPSWAEISGKPTAKRTETYSGVTNASGVFTVTFPVPFTTIPSVQASIPNQLNTNQMIRVSNVSLTGFTVNVFQRAAVTLLSVEVLLAATTNVPAIPVDVLVIEK